MNGDGLDAVISDTARLQAEAGADRSLLLASLEAIASYHETAETGLELNPPITESSLEDFTSRLGCELPEELRTLWTWRNGERTDYFIWYHRFLSVDAALKEYRTLTSNTGYRWRPDWIPVFEFQGEWYGVECRKAPFKASPVVHYFIEAEPVIAYTNLTSFMKTMSKALELDAVRWNGIAWEEDIQALARLHADLNPGIGFPYYVPAED